YLLPSTVSDDMYAIRDSVFWKTKKGAELIDDYYYVSSIVKENNISLDLALAVYEVSNTGLLRKLRHMNSTNYGDSILITETEFDLIMNAVDEAELISLDHRFQ